MFLMVELSGAKGRFDEECGVRGEEENVLKNIEVSGLRA